MKKNWILIFLSLIIFNIQASKYSDKTYLSTRPKISNLPMQQTAWHTILYRRPDAKYNGTIQICPFYQESTNKVGIGQYFGFDWGGNRGIENIISVAPADNTKVFASNRILHNYDAGNNSYPANALAAEYSLRPNQEVWGVRLDYQQDLDKIFDGLYFRISTPLVEVKNNFDISAINPETSQQIPHVESGALVGKSVTFLDYLAGRVENRDTANRQAPLRYAKIDGSGHSSSGLADVDVRLGIKFLYKRNARASMNFSLLIPTGKTPKGEWLFEAVHGNGHHWAIGFGLDGKLTFWRKDNKSIEFMIAGDYKYLFQGIEKRTFDFYYSNPNQRIAAKAGHYILGGQSGVAGVFPLANVLTQEVKVTPGHQFDGIANLNINCNNWVIDLGYNLFAKEKEEVHTKNPWQNDTYAIAGTTYNTANNDFNILVADTSQAYAYENAPAGTNAAIQEQHLDYDSVRSPNAVTHKVFGSVGYQWNQNKYPVMIGLGSSYEFVQRNSALEGWSMWTKLGISW